MTELEERLRNCIVDVPDFPKKGILFKDITPILANPTLVNDLIQQMADFAKPLKIDAVAAIESRGFLFGIMLAGVLELPFIPIRKEGKLPQEVVRETYELEYGTATLEAHKNAFRPGMKILIHDDLLATGGTAMAAAKIISKLGGTVAGFSFLVELKFLEGSKVLQKISDCIDCQTSY